MQDRYKEGDALLGLGSIYTFLDEGEAGKEHLRSALRIQNEVGDRVGECESHWLLGQLNTALGEYTTAEHIPPVT